MSSSFSRVLSLCCLLTALPHIGSSLARAEFYAVGNTYPVPNYFNTTPFDPLNYGGGVYAGIREHGELYVGYVVGPSTLNSDFGVIGELAYEPGGNGWPGGDGYVAVLGAWNMTGPLDVGLRGQGILNVLGSISAGWANLGTHPGAGGTMSVSGNFTTSGDLDVGEAGGGQLRITGNGIVTSGFARIGGEAGGIGLATLESNATWNVAGYLGVGHAGTGTLNLTGFGPPYTTAPTLSTGFATLGFEALAYGTATLTNGSHWNNNDGLFIGNYGDGDLTVATASTVTTGFVEVAQRGTGNLAIETGGSVVAAGSVALGNTDAGSNGTVTVYGANSKLTAGTFMNVGNLGRGTLTVHSGGLVSMPGDFSVGVNPGSQSTVNINNGGTVTVGQTATIGGWWSTYGGQGALNVNTGGTLNVGYSLIVWERPSGVASANIQGGTVTAAGGVQNKGGFVTIGAGSLNTTAIQNAGTINLTGGTLTADSISNTGTFSFTGGTMQVNTFTGNLTNNGGTLAPGMSPGTTTIVGNYAQNSPGRLQIELASPTSFDKLVVTGNLAISGAYLDVSLLGGYAPAAGYAFDILDWGSLSLIGGAFNVQLPALNSGLVWNTSRLYTTGVLSVGVPGDYNNDNVVNGADYVVWRNNDGTPAAYNIWRANFGQTAGSAVGASGSASAVPEPATPLLFMFGAARSSIWRARRRLVQPV